MSVTYFVALPFIDSEDGPMPAAAVECQSSGEAKTRADSMARKPDFVGAVAFQRKGDPAVGEFSDAELLGRYGITPDDFAGV